MNTSAPCAKRVSRLNLDTYGGGFHGESPDFPGVLADFGVISAEL
jgi:hypothetical protein